MYDVLDREPGNCERINAPEMGSEAMLEELWPGLGMPEMEEDSDECRDPECLASERDAYGFESCSPDETEWGL